MIRFIIHGRGGRGGVTLAKLIAGAYFLQGKYVQAFGVYGAERTGAPVKAFVRVDDEEIVRHGPVETADCVVIIDPSLVSAQAAAGLDFGGCLILNASTPPGAFAHVFPGRRVATVDANGIAVANGLGSQALPIVNTTMLGAVARVLGLELNTVDRALGAAGLVGSNLTAAHTAYEHVRVTCEPGVPVQKASALPAAGPPYTATFGSSLPSAHTGGWASSWPHDRSLSAVCAEACPAGNDVRGFVQAAAREDYDEALAIILRTSPFPGTCGRVCPAPCMGACNRAWLDAPVNIRELERAVAEHGRWPEPETPSFRTDVAVVGSGPAGLSAAYHLGRSGYRVTVFEAEGEMGGLLRSGIPPYRLPRNVLEREIGFILAHGVRIESGHRVAGEELLQLRQDFAAVVLAPGLQHPRSLVLCTPSNRTVVQGLDFLRQAWSSCIDCTGEKVVVIGGGNTAMDAARTALRLGANHVRVLYRRTRAEMPAIAEEVEEALEEGIVVEQLVAPVEFEDGGASGLLICRRMRLEEPDESGRPRPVPEEGETALITFECDRLILALGQSPDLSILPTDATVLDGRILCGDKDLRVLAGGDFASMAGTVSAAIGSGRQAASRLDAELQGLAEVGEPSAPVAGLDSLALCRFPESPQHQGALLDVRERRRSFAEVRLGMTGSLCEAVVSEAHRCLSCGSCNGCGACAQFCPEGVVGVVEERRFFVDYRDCKGCGLCAAICPRGAIAMEECCQEVST